MAESTNNGKTPVEAPSGHPKIKLQFNSQDGTQTTYANAASKKIKYLLMEYCKRKNLQYGTVVFLHNGQRVATNLTPLELGMDDGDEIDDMLHHTGGGSISVKM
ncbi:Ubiquitin-like protein [Handroanthus impetiginosus]|uniref:Ubiquitin-like protein n=1 Tax=Handroanthus impetiginosus TaxID=429701 RepID=A0A2G9HCY3_9LAMI|nr:Ubiquitin-like protein [Handroanthus impetiginosus]